MLYTAISALALLAILTAAVLIPVRICISLSLRRTCAYVQIKLFPLCGLIGFYIKQGIFPAPGGGFAFCGPLRKTFGKSVSKEVFKAQNKRIQKRARSFIKSEKRSIIESLDIKSIELRQSIGGASAPDRAATACGALRVFYGEIKELFPRVRTRVSVLPSFTRGEGTLDVKCIAVFQTGKFIIEVIKNKLRRSTRK